MTKIRFLVSATLVSGALVLSGCGGSVLEGKKIDYKSAGKVPSLEVPPDLSPPPRDERYSVPDLGPGRGGATTYSTYSTGQSGRPAPAAAGVLPDVAKARVMKSGEQRWLEVDQSPDQAWVVVKQFWQDSGFTVESERPEAGVMETGWAENRAKLPQDFIRNTIGKVLEGLYSTGERDKFRTRLEPGAKSGTTDIFVSHRGLEEAYSGRDQERVVWRPRASDPGLEAEMLRRMLARFGGEEAQAKEQLVAEKRVDQARLVTENGSTVVRVDEPFDRAWRRVGLALDRSGFTVEDRDRSQGLFFVRFVDPDSGEKPGFFSRMFSSDKGKTPTSQFRIKVSDAASGSVVSVSGKNGEPDNSPASGKILSLLHAQLK